MRKFISIFVLGFCCGLAFSKDLTVIKIKSSHIKPDFGFSEVSKQHWQMGVY